MCILKTEGGYALPVYFLAKEYVALNYTQS